ncbi:MAG TPA: hypothetical protein VFB58_16590 [Chloroflexota bacterium]|nr:hypothetical protein [Chloroflexota bacterium]
MPDYDVIVRNELTGQEEVVRVSSDGARQAQVEALRHQFHSCGWRKASAFIPRECEMADNEETAQPAAWQVPAEASA